MKKLTYEDVKARVGFFRQKKNLSARATSFLLDKTQLYVTRLENGDIKISVPILLKLCEVLEISIFDFFYLGKEYNPESKNVLELFGNLSANDQQTILKLMKSLQK